MFSFDIHFESKSCAICKVFVVDVLCERLCQVKENHYAGNEVKLSERFDGILSAGDKNRELENL